jgi:tripartite ATP-independent transporter DctP family solute receptor
MERSPMKRVFNVTMLAIALLLCWAAPTFAQKTLKLNESIGPGSPEDAALLVFKKEVEERSKGSLKIEIYLQDALGNAQSSFENLMTGSLDLYSGSLEYYQALVPQELSVVSLPYILKDNEHLRRYLKSPIFQEAEKKLLARGIRFISTEFNAVRGPYRVIFSTKPILKLEDLQGMKVRMNPNEVAIRSWRNFGAVPITMGWNEIYLALRQGVVQAATAPLGLVRSSKFTEVAPYVTATYEYPQVWPMAVSERVWKKLNADEQKILVDSAKIAGDAYTKITAESAERDMQWMMDHDSAVFIRINVEPFHKKMEPFYQELISQGMMSREVYEGVKALTP